MMRLQNTEYIHIFSWICMLGAFLALCIAILKPIFLIISQTQIVNGGAI